MSDAFDALTADTAPIQPDSRFADHLRRRIITEMETVMTDLAAPTPPIINTVTPYLCVDGAAGAIDFYVAAFGAIEQMRMVGDDGRVGHAEIVIGGSRLMLADEYPEVGVLSPTTRGGTSTNFMLEVPDVDLAFATAIDLGAAEVRPPADQFHGSRHGTVRDPFGHQWTLSTPIAGFDQQQFVEQSHAAGFTVERSDARDGDHQIKHYDAGDLYYFSLPARDLAKAQAFFAAVLGWQFDAPETGHIGNIAAPPGSVGGTGDAGVRLYFVVDDIHAAVGRVRQMGGTSADPVHNDSGWSADCVDDQGTVFSLSVPADKYRN
jgi:uncharacterized glyoxalase superfamily protein PhnB/predicted enzyme related to lactoylglutathione lyase